MCFKIHQSAELKNYIYVSGKFIQTGINNLKY